MKRYQMKCPNDFELQHILECGQCFRWKKEDDFSYTGVVKTGVINIKKTSSKELVIKCELEDDSIESIREYFDLNRDYHKIKKLHNMTFHQIASCIPIVGT